MKEYLIVFIIPLLLFVCGIISKKKPPKEINSFYGYRTPRSMRDKHNWEPAQRLMSNFFIYYSAGAFAIAALLTVLCRLFYNKDFMPSVIMLIQAIGIFSIFPVVENKLKKLNSSTDKDKNAVD
ncbi:MAG: SdpI family protein [Eubacterium sp.]